MVWLMVSHRPSARSRWRVGSRGGSTATARPSPSSTRYEELPSPSSTSAATVRPEPFTPRMVLRRKFFVKRSFEYLTKFVLASTITPMGDRAAKDALYDAFAEVAKALASGRRAEIVDLLAQSERSVDEIAEEIGQTVANTSHHLRAMARAGVLRTRREGTRVVYMLASDHVAVLWAAMRGVAAEHVAGLDRLAQDYLGDRSRLEAVDRRELAARLEAGDIVVLDVRPTPEFEAGHIPGARSVPVDELRQHLRSLPKDVEVVAYCRGPYCIYADDAVRMLRRRGYRARRLEDGFPEWKQAGLPVAAGAGG
jgi:rhodanese-related sulfurtransferase/predicted transcriptional regulator